MPCRVVPLDPPLQLRASAWVSRTPVTGALFPFLASIPFNLDHGFFYHFAAALFARRLLRPVASLAQRRLGGCAQPFPHPPSVGVPFPPAVAVRPAGPRPCGLACRWSFLSTLCPFGISYPDPHGWLGALIEGGVLSTHPNFPSAPCLCHWLQNFMVAQPPRPP